MISNEVLRDFSYRILESVGILFALVVKVGLYGVGIAGAAFVFVHTFLFLMSNFHSELFIK